MVWLVSGPVSSREFLDQHGRRGGNPGFVQILDDRSLRIPDYSGNSMFNTLGNLIVNRGQMLLEKSRKPAEAGNKAALLKDSRALFDEAFKVFTDLHADLKMKLDAMPKILDEKKDAKRFELREQMRMDYLQKNYKRNS